MEIEKYYDLAALVNENERSVLAELGSRLENEIENGLCDCQDCVLDIITLALNALEPRYHVSLMGNIYSRLAVEEGQTDRVSTAVSMAIKKVKQNPSHE